MPAIAQKDKSYYGEPCCIAGEIFPADGASQKAKAQGCAFHLWRGRGDCAPQIRCPDGQLMSKCLSVRRLQLQGRCLGTRIPAAVGWSGHRGGALQKQHRELVKEVRALLV